ncbi:helix-turn-helix domain-containing protein [Clostridium sp. JN-1]|uniref:PucR family transcriptional regulator n=1 Tax=Clostridium sp. JN-1 TaxID=2483110 RepID=UPI000F0B6325|nr:helix-turn-helix domain-containing protein [Clostridium sp. JN-1]
MDSFTNFLKQLAKNTESKFNLIESNGHELFKGFNMKNCEVISLNLSLNNKEVGLYVPKEYRSSLKLLRYIIISKYNNNISKNQKIILNILEGKEVDSSIKNELSFLLKKCSLLIINADGDKIEALDIINKLYENFEMIGVIYKDDIVIIGSFDDVCEHVNGIRESIMSDLYCKCCISVSNSINDYKDIRKSYFEALESMALGKKFGIKDGIYYYKNTLLEKIVYNLKSDVKDELMCKFKDILSEFDKDMILTIQEFFKCELNISNTAKRLYIHRNTLIYRLNKLKKDTGFDIRNFHEAVIFIVIFYIWKEKK